MTTYSKEQNPHAMPAHNFFRLKQSVFFKHNGFSLVEMTVVLLLITLLASVAVRETSELGFQTRYEVTKDRLEMIKQAILGNPRQITNGQQAISGFVADMGRLPVNLRELVDNSTPHSDCDLNSTVDLDGDGDATHDLCRPLANGNCIDSTGTAWLPFFNQQSCISNNVSNSWQPNLGNMTVGWNGPYLSISGSPADNDALTDGWGATSDNLLYGWAFCLGNSPDVTTPANCYSPTNTTAGRGQLSLISTGKNQTLSNTDMGYDEDYPAIQPSISWQDWLIDLTQNGVYLNFLVPYGGECGFPGNPAVVNTGAGCVLAGGTWDRVTSTCTTPVNPITESHCTNQGGHWQSCQFTPEHCTSAVADGGLGLNWGQSCQFSYSVCSRLSGTWSSAAGACTFTTQAQCTNYGGAWNTTTSECSFERSQCESLDGTWVKECQFTSAACTGTGTSWNANTNRCEFSVAACTSSGGTPPAFGDCQITHDPSNGARFTQTSCFSATNSSSAWSFRSTPVCLNITSRDNAALQATRSQDVFINEDGQPHTTRFNFPADALGNNILVPVGRNAVTLREADGDCDDNNLVYPSNRQAPMQVDFRANTTLPVINW